MKRTLATLGLVVAALLLASVGQAASIGFAPSAQTVNGSPVMVDVVVSGLGGEIVSAYDLDVVYDASILLATQVDFGPSLGTPPVQVDNFFDVSVAGVVDLGQVSFLTDAQILALQGGDSVTLATLTFDAVSDGTTALTFDFSPPNEVVGANAQPLQLEVETGAVTVAAVPEPGAALLFAAGAALTAARVRRTARG